LYWADLEKHSKIEVKYWSSESAKKRETKIKKYPNGWWGKGGVGEKGGEK
jgi:hypothetical protein